MTRVISFSSGKGGVGKTSLVVNLGIVFAQSGHRTLLIDGDWALGKLGILFGARTQWTIEQVLKEEITLDKAVHPLREKLWMLASPSGVVGREELSEKERNQLYFEIETLAEQFDLILFDHSSGIHWGVLPFVAAAHQHVVVLTTDPSSCTDAYAIMKVLTKRFACREFYCLVTMSDNAIETKRIFDRFAAMVTEHLGVRVNLLGVIPRDMRFNVSAQKRMPLAELYPTSELRQHFEMVCSRMKSLPLAPGHGLRFFYQPQL